MVLERNTVTLQNQTKQICYRSDLAVYSPSLLRKNGKASALVRPSRSGILFHQYSMNNVVLLNEGYNCLFHTYLLCRHVFSLRERGIALASLRRVQRFLIHWKEIFSESVVAKQLLHLGGLTLRLRRTT